MRLPARDLVLLNALLSQTPARQMACPCWARARRGSGQVRRCEGSRADSPLPLPLSASN
jgi:hypothetical protein